MKNARQKKYMILKFLMELSKLQMIIKIYIVACP